MGRPFIHTIAVDRMAMVRTHARACSQSRDYLVVAVPYSLDAAGNVIEDLTQLSAEERRFVVEDVTPAEYEVETGQRRAGEIDRSR